MNSHALYTSNKKAMRSSKRLEEYHHMEKQEKKKGDNKLKSGENLSSSNLQVKIKFFLAFIQPTLLQQTSAPKEETRLAFVSYEPVQSEMGHELPTQLHEGHSASEGSSVWPTHQLSGAGQPPGLLAC